MVAVRERFVVRRPVFSFCCVSRYGEAEHRARERVLSRDRFGVDVVFTDIALEGGASNESVIRSCGASSARGTARFLCFAMANEPHTLAAFDAPQEFERDDHETKLFVGAGVADAGSGVHAHGRARTLGGRTGYAAPNTTGLRRP
jgi:hypothetical protein